MTTSILPFRPEPISNDTTVIWPDFSYVENAVIGQGKDKVCYEVDYSDSQGTTSKKAVLVQEFLNNIDSIQDIATQILIQKDLEGHPAIVKNYQSVCFEFENLFYWIQVQELYQGNLVQGINAGLFNTNILLTHNVILQLLKGLVYIEVKGVLLRDLKADNILYRQRSDGSFELVYSDWGGADSNTSKSLHLRSSNNYKAPELFQRKPATQKSVVFSLGVVLALFRFDGNNKKFPYQVMKEKTFREFTLRVEEFSASIFNTPWKKTIQKMLSIIPQNRPFASQALVEYEGIAPEDIQNYRLSLDPNQ
jgi:serine/threonine protein kinase